MNNTYIVKIIENYKAQYGLYNQLLSLSAKQLELLNTNPANTSEDLHMILSERQKLLDEINSLNNNNKSWQTDLVVDFKLESFSLSKLEKAIAPNLYEDLNEILATMGILLQAINDNDKVSETLIRQRTRQNQATSPSKASAAYQNAVKNLTPPTPPKS